MKRIVMTLVMMFALSASATQANAQRYGRYGFRGYSGYSYGGYSGYGNGYGNGYGSYYGNGGHDLQPHGHVTQNPFGQYSWYGNGPHDLAPHQHSQTPWSYQGFSNTGAGPTTSYYNQQPYYYAPW